MVNTGMITNPNSWSLEPGSNKSVDHLDPSIPIQSSGQSSCGLLHVSARTLPLVGTLGGDLSELCARPYLQTKKNFVTSEPAGYFQQEPSSQPHRAGQHKISTIYCAANVLISTFRTLNQHDQHVNFAHSQLSRVPVQALTNFDQHNRAFLLISTHSTAIFLRTIRSTHR